MSSVNFYCPNCKHETVGTPANPATSCELCWCRNDFVKELVVDVDALEAVRRLTLERDALAIECARVRDHLKTLALGEGLVGTQQPTPEATTEPQTCAACRFWLEQEVKAEHPRRGDCRLCPPAPDPDSSFGAFPVTMHDCWCGEWQAK